MSKFIDTPWKRLILVFLIPVILILATLIAFVFALAYFVDATIYGPCAWIVTGKYDSFFAWLFT